MERRERVEGRVIGTNGDNVTLTCIAYFAGIKPPMEVPIDSKCLGAVGIATCIDSKFTAEVSPDARSAELLKPTDFALPEAVS